MPQITLPDGSQRSFDRAITVQEIAEDIGAGLARAAVAGKVDGKPVDLSFRVDADANVAILTGRDDEGLEVIRHSTSHLLAQAVKELFPDAQVTFGPAIEDGFYYDFAYERSFTPEDLEKIETKMRELAKADHTVTRKVMSRDEAAEYFESIGESYKAQHVRRIADDEPISLYGQGEFWDLCSGPHVPSTGKLGAFKLTKLAGAYWLGDSNNEMLQRVYGTAWPDKKSLKQYLHRLEEAEKRDHRRFGKLLDLFHTQPEAPGMVFWHDKGWTLYREVENYIRGRLAEHDYQEVRTPQILDRSLWEKSGHWAKFREDMFTTGSEDRQFAIKPMNCPCHVQIYNQTLHSFRDLPIRMSEFGSCHRNEASGTLHGLMRVRNFVQDDAHIFCTEDQIHGEVLALIELILDVYRDFGFDEPPVINLSTRPENRVGSDEFWDKAETALRAALDDTGLDWAPQEGEGAFYGPKIDFSLKDSIGRVWQVGTVQADFSTPQRLGAEYVASDGSRQIPVMIHRAILGSLERFIGVLIEHYAGSLPVWLAPVQAVAMTITGRQDGYVSDLVQALKNQGFRVESDLRNEKIGFKIREHTIQRVPYLLVAGDREADSNTVAVRTRAGEDLGSMTLDAFAGRLANERASRGRVSLED